MKGDRPIKFRKVCCGFEIDQVALTVTKRETHTDCQPKSRQAQGQGSQEMSPSSLSQSLTIKSDRERWTRPAPNCNWPITWL